MSYSIQYSIVTFTVALIIVLNGEIVDISSEVDLKGDGTSVAVLHLYDSFYQKCSKLGTVTTLGLKNKGRE
jgi:hypothetical protein